MFKLNKSLSILNHLLYFPLLIVSVFLIVKYYSSNNLSIWNKIKKKQRGVTIKISEANFENKKMVANWGILIQSKII